MTKYTLELNDYASKIEMREFVDDNIAQIIVNNKIIAEYEMGGAGCSLIYDTDPKKLIDTLVAVLYDQAKFEVKGE
jgi:hypothetical protein